MAEEKQLRVIQKMIKAGMYDEARAALMSMNHPTADKWLRKLNQMSPPKTRPQPRKRQDDFEPEPRKSKSKIDAFYADVDDDPRQPEGNSTASMIVVVVVLIGIGVLLVGGAVMIAQPSFLETPITTDETGCGAQAWVNEIDGSFNDLYRYSLWDMIGLVGDGTGYVDEDLRSEQIAELESRLARIENSTAPDCVANAKENMIDAYEAQIAATRNLDIHNPYAAFSLFGRTFTLMKETGTALVELGAQFRRVDSAAIRQVVNPDCPAFEYVTKTMYVDNQFMVILLTDPELSTLDQLYSLIRDLAQQYYSVKDDPNVPACLWEVRNQFVEMIDGAHRAFEAITGSDLYGFESHYARYLDALNQFYVEVEKVGLDPAQFGGNTLYRGE